MKTKSEKIPNLFLRLLIFLGWRGRDCPVCGFCEAVHYEPDERFRIDRYPCAGDYGG